MRPKIIEGKRHSDHRGTLFYNNDFDVSEVKRIYVIENENNEVLRRWQGHKVEQRWFSAIKGKVKIELIKIDNWNKPSHKLKSISFVIDDKELKILYVPAGYVSSIQSIEDGSKLLVMADYLLGEINDDYKFESNYFER
ncbi:WxcM-like domain-containing protein [Flavobacterium phragmitis]|uniref:WxcM-like, C-terminal n=1 Tax=Flavobacterium phragmitis TaxID=739143 RepID=A0A1I1URQ6_9FLAO|nr:WxcM-like domain-containing protein [Flavobacterium phragmitis]SFD73467.1 WxcM-like, C-terminal [Flavobacterium phragmitis]